MPKISPFKSRARVDVVGKPHQEKHDGARRQESRAGLKSPVPIYFNCAEDRNREQQSPVDEEDVRMRAFLSQRTDRDKQNDSRQNRSLPGVFGANLLEHSPQHRRESNTKPQVDVF